MDGKLRYYKTKVNNLLIYKKSKEPVICLLYSDKLNKGSYKGVLCNHLWGGGRMSRRLQGDTLSHC